MGWWWAQDWAQLPNVISFSRARVSARIVASWITYEGDSHIPITFSQELAARTLRYPLRPALVANSLFQWDERRTISKSDFRAKGVTL